MINKISTSRLGGATDKQKSTSQVGGTTDLSQKFGNLCCKIDALNENDNVKIKHCKK